MNFRVFEVLGVPVLLLVLPGLRCTFKEKGVRRMHAKMEVERSFEGRNVSDFKGKVSATVMNSEKQVQDKEVKARRGRKPTLANQGKLKRYNLILPEDLYEAVQKIAEEQHMMVIEVLRKFIRLGILAADVGRDPDSKLIIRETGKMDREVLLL